MCQRLLVHPRYTPHLGPQGCLLGVRRGIWRLSFLSGYFMPVVMFVVIGKELSPRSNKLQVTSVGAVSHIRYI